MRGSIKANLLVFSIIALISFGVSTAFTNLTVHGDNDSYKLIPIEDDSFEPNYIEEVPTYIPPKNDTNTTNATQTNTTYSNIENTIDEWYNNTTEYYDNWSETYFGNNNTYEEYW